MFRSKERGKGRHVGLRGGFSMSGLQQKRENMYVLLAQEIRWKGNKVRSIASGSKLY